MTDDFDALYGNKYLGAADLNGQTKRAKIRGVNTEELREKDGGTRRKYVLYFEGEEKGLPLNKTNATRLASAFGKPRNIDEARDKWIGKPVELYAEMTSLGKEGVRLRPLQPPRQAANAQPDPELDDAIPY
jgi:hypothetical protein